MTRNLSVVRKLDRMMAPNATASDMSGIPTTTTMQPTIEDTLQQRLTYEEVLQLWYTHYQVWQANINSRDAYQAYIAVVDELAEELDTNPDLPCLGNTEAMLESCSAWYARRPTNTAFNTLSGMMLYHQHKAH